MNATRRFPAQVRALHAVLNQFDSAGIARKAELLRTLQATPLPLNAGLVALHDALLFLAAHPASPAQARATDALLRRIATHLKAQPAPLPKALHNQGLPFAPTRSRFSHDCARWLLAHPHAKVSVAGWPEPQWDLNAVLKTTLTSLERRLTTAGLGNEDLLDVLGVKPAQRLRFLVDELARFDAQPLLKDQLFDGLDTQLQVQPRHRELSKAFNRLPMPARFIQGPLLKRFDVGALLNTPLPPPRALNAAQRAQAVQVLKNTMLLTVRETDPATYLHEPSLRLVDLERGLTVALFGMVAQRQLPLESYVGFTLFKNGLPCAYGGSWVLGERTDFGMNIFEPYRGGESGYMMCQVLRAYAQAFDTHCFEVDAGQFGLDNPDGIASGAYWFYHRHGFRSLDPKLAALAEREQAANARQPGRRSSERTLLKFTGSNMALNLREGGRLPPRLDEVCDAVTAFISRRHGGSRAAAEREAVARFLPAVPQPQALTADEHGVLVEMALIADALAVRDAPRRAMLAHMVRTKPADPYAYQQWLLKFLRSAPSRPGM